MYFLFLFLLFINLSESYIFTNFLNNPIIKKLTPKEFNINHYNDFLATHIKNDRIMNKIHDINMDIFKKVTEYLPEFHKAGDNVLDMNQKLIHNILESNIDSEIKKKVIASILDLTLVFDHAASHFLHIYQDFVHHIM